MFRILRALCNSPLHGSGVAPSGRKMLLAERQYCHARHEVLSLSFSAGLPFAGVGQFTAMKAFHDSKSNNTCAFGISFFLTNSTITCGSRVTSSGMSGVKILNSFG